MPPSILRRPGAILPFEMKSLQTEAGRVQHAVMICCDCPTHTASVVWVHQLNPTMICEKFERLGWEVYKNKARCPDCKKARARQKSHFAQLDQLRKREEAMQTHRNGHLPANNSNMAPARPPSPPPPAHPPARPEPIEVPPVEVIRTYLMTVMSDGSVELRDLDAAKEMLFGNETFLVIPR